MGLTGIILARNEEKKIGQKIKELSFCNEVIVIDDDSTDQTAKTARKLGAKVYKHSLNNDFASQRNFALQKARSQWVLFIDADEHVSKSLAKEILQKIRRKNIDVYKIKRTDIRWGRKMKYGEAGNAYLLRLARKSKAPPRSGEAGRWRRKVHEVWDINGNVGTLKNELLHYPEENLFALLNKTTKYAINHGDELVKEKKNPKFWKILVYPAGKFKDSLINKKSHKDGWQGMLLAVIMSYHSFLGWGWAWWISRKQSKYS